MGQHKLSHRALSAVVTLLTALILTGEPRMAQAQETASPSSVQETYQSWVVGCVTPQAVEGQPAPGRVCEMRQELRQAEGNQRVLAVALQPAAEGDGASLTLVAPFGLLLSQPIAIDIAEARVIDVPFRTCFPQGCLATTQLPQAGIDQMAAGDEAVITMTTQTDQALTMRVSLAGFTAAWNRLLDLQNG